MKQLGEFTRDSGLSVMLHTEVDDAIRHTVWPLPCDHESY